MYRTLALSALASVAVMLGCSPTPQEEAQSSRGFSLPAGDVEAGKQAVLDLRCTTCHEVHGYEDEFPRPTATPVVGVTLGGLAMREPSDGELLTSIINPSHELYPATEQQNVTSGEESRMANLNESMTVQQMIDIVAFLHDRYETAQ